MPVRVISERYVDRKDVIDVAVVDHSGRCGLRKIGIPIKISVRVFGVESKLRREPIQINTADQCLCTVSLSASNAALRPTAGSTVFPREYLFLARSATLSTCQKRNECQKRETNSDF